MRVALAADVPRPAGTVAVDDDLVLAQRALEVGEVLGLGCERATQSTTTSAFVGRLGVLVALEMAVGHRPRGRARRTRRPAPHRASQHDRHAGAAPAQGQSEAERAGGADDRNGLAQGRRVYVPGQVTQLPQERAHPRSRPPRRLPERARGHRDRRQGPSRGRAHAHGRAAHRGDELVARRCHPAAGRRRGGADAQSTLRPACRCPSSCPTSAACERAGLPRALQQINVFLSASETHTAGTSTARSASRSSASSRVPRARPRGGACAARASSRWPSAARMRATSRPSACSTSLASSSAPARG